jgi:hypothetical protein
MLADNEETKMAGVNVADSAWLVGPCDECGGETQFSAAQAAESYFLPGSASRRSTST